MAQIVRLRRSSVLGKKPTNAQLELGELSINTGDGKVFLAKSGSGGPSIEELISTNTVNTGSINLIGDITASNFVGNGSGITNVISSSYAVSSSYSVSSSYAGLAFTIESTPGSTQLLTVTTPATTWTFNHNLGEQFPVIQVYDDNGFVVIPTSIEMFSDITTIITFSLAQSGYATATVGGGLPAISSSYVGRVLQTDGVGASWEPIGSILTANKIVSGSVSASISPNRGFEINTDTTVTGSINISGSQNFIGNQTLIGNKTITGSLYIQSGSEFPQSTGSSLVTYNQTTGQFAHANFASVLPSLVNYGAFSDLTTQSGSLNTAYAMKLNTTDLASGFSIVSGSRITAANAGTYNLQFSVQLEQTTNNAADVSIWLRKDGTNVPNSNTDLTVQKTTGGGVAKMVAAWNFIVQLNATQYVELMWSSTRSDTQLHYHDVVSTPSRPATPSVIVTMTQIS